MAITVLFLISCVITARMLEKKKMHAASVAYTVLFVVLLAALFLTVDFEPINRALTNVMGAKTYLQTQNALLYALRSDGYGTCIISALLLTFIIQLALPVAFAVTGLVRILFKKQETKQSKKDKYRSSRLLNELYLKRYINLLYCRMLN